MTKRSIQRVVVIVLCFLLSQSVHHSQTTNDVNAPAVVKLRMQLELNKPRQVTFSPVSKLLAVQREDGSVRIIDIRDGHEQAVLPLTGKGFYGMEWTRDGLRLLIISSESAAMWDARTGTRVTKPIEIRSAKHFVPFGEVKLSQDEKLLLNLYQDTSIRAIAFGRDRAMAQVWNVESGQFKFEIKVKGAYARAQFSANGKQILTTSDTADARLWDVETGRLFTILRPPQPALFREGSNAQFSPDGRFVIQGHEQGIYIWHSSTGALNTRIPYHKDISDCVFLGFTPDGKMFATAQQLISWHPVTTITLHDCETGELKTTLTAKKWDYWPNQMLWSNDGRTFVAASGRKYEAKVWDVGTATLKATFPMVLTYSRFPLSFGYKDRDQLTIHPTLPVISAASNKFIRLWNAENGELLQKLDNTSGSGVWSADGTLFLTFTEDQKSAHVWDVVEPEVSANALSRGL